jgi:hypothetical protein
MSYIVIERNTADALTLPAGSIVIAPDPQERLGEETWCVYRQGDGTFENDNVQLGLFWQSDHARLFAAAVRPLNFG